MTVVISVHRGEGNCAPFLHSSRLILMMSCDTPETGALLAKIKLSCAFSGVEHINVFSLLFHHISSYSKVLFVQVIGVYGEKKICISQDILICHFEAVFMINFGGEHIIKLIRWTCYCPVYSIVEKCTMTCYNSD